MRERPGRWTGCERRGGGNPAREDEEEGQGGGGLEDILSGSGAVFDIVALTLEENLLNEVVGRVLGLGGGGRGGGGRLAGSSAMSSSWA